MPTWLPLALAAALVWLAAACLGVAWGYRLGLRRGQGGEMPRAAIAIRRQALETGRCPICDQGVAGLDRGNG
jgi:hypothetical protein